jgi:hypothetical protein
MPGKSNTLETAILNAVLLGSPQLPTNSQVWVGLFITTPTGPYDTAAVEVSTGGGSNYARVQVGFLTPPVNGVTSNTEAIIGPATLLGPGPLTFPQVISPPGPTSVAGADWGAITGTAAPITGVGIFNSQTASGSPDTSLLYYGPLGVAVTVLTGDSITFAIGALSVAEQ